MSELEKKAPEELDDEALEDVAGGLLLNKQVAQGRSSLSTPSFVGQKILTEKKPTNPIKGNSTR